MCAPVRCRPPTRQGCGDASLHVPDEPAPAGYVARTGAAGGLVARKQAASAPRRVRLRQSAEGPRHRISRPHSIEWRGSFDDHRADRCRQRHRLHHPGAFAVSGSGDRDRPQRRECRHHGQAAPRNGAARSNHRSDGRYGSAAGHLESPGRDRHSARERGGRGRRSGAGTLRYGAG